MRYDQYYLVSKMGYIHILKVSTDLRPNFFVTANCGVETFVQGTCVQGDSCPSNICPRRQLSKETVIQGDNCPRKTYVQGDFRPRRHLSKETVTCILVQGYFFRLGYVRLG